MHRSLLLLVPLLVGDGCTSLESGGSSSDVVLRVEPTTVAPGDSLGLVLENNTGDRIGYNLCTSGLERRAGESWQPLPSDRFCTMELRVLAPGQQARFTLRLRQGLPAGEYRPVTGIERMETGSRIGLAGEPFRVEP